MRAAEAPLTRRVGATQSTRYNPLAKQYRERDTTFLFDPDEERYALVSALGGAMPSNWPNGDRLWSAAGGIGQTVALIDGKYRKGIHPGPAIGGLNPSYVFEPGHPLLGTNRFHVEGWAKCDVAWADCGDQKMFAVGTQNNGIQLSCTAGILTFRFRHEQHTAPVSEVINYSVSANPLEAEEWVQWAMSYAAGVFYAIVGGVVVGSVSGLVDPVIWGDTSLADGVQIGGYTGVLADKFAFSDIRISSEPRVAGETIVLHDYTEVTVDPLTPEGGADIDQLTLGELGLQGLIGVTGVPPVLEPIVSNVFGPTKVVRIGGLAPTPIKAGAPDATHPDAGISGELSYDWRAVDRMFGWVEDRGAQSYPEFGSCPQFFGGAHPPFTDEQLDRAFHWTFSDEAGTIPDGFFDNTVPNDFALFATACADMAYHVIEELGYEVPYWTLWNEPDGDFFWAGTQLEFFQLYVAWATKMRAVLGPTVKLGGPEVSGFGSTQAGWIEGLISYCADPAHPAPIDFISWHFYSGDLSEIVRVRRKVNQWITDHAYPDPIADLINGEWTWSNSQLFTGDPGTTPPDEFHHPMSEWHYHINDWSAAFILCTLLLGRRFGVIRNVFTTAWSELGMEAYYSSGLAAHANAWAPLNVYRLWALLADSPVISHTFGQRDPGIDCLAVQNGVHVDVVLASLHYRKTRDYRVKINVDVPDGTATRVYVVDDEHSNYLEAGAAHEGLESYVGPTVEDGSVIVTLRPRAAALVRIG